VQSAVEDLPAELEGIATEVYVQFPWGSLLRGVVGGDEVIIGNLRRICSRDALLQITIGLDPERDRSEWERLQLPEISLDNVRSVLVAKYETAGFRVVEVEELTPAELPEFQTSWARRLQGSSDRSYIRIVARAMVEWQW